MLEAVLQCAQPHRWIELAVDGYSATVDLLDSKILPNDLVQHLFDVQVEPGLADELLAAIRKDKDIIEMEAMKSKSGHIYGSAASRRCTVCKEVAESKCFLESVSVSSRKRAQWTILGNDESFRDLLRALEEKKISVEVKLRRNLKDSELLTARQEQVLSIAFERGYFEFPKKMGLKELATQTGIKTSTLSEILRRAQKKILAEYLARRSLLHQNRKTA